MKRILAISLALIIGLSLSAQIQNKILGFTLGKTNRAEVYNQYKNELLFTEDEISISVGNVRFAGQIWDTVIFKFYDNKLMSAYFSISEDYVPLSYLETIWNDFKDKLWDKYSDYYVTNSESDFILYSDGKTDLALSYTTLGSERVNLLYSDWELSMLQRQAENDEL